MVVYSAMGRHWVGCASTHSPERQSASVTLLEMCAHRAPCVCAKLREAPCWQIALVFIRRYCWQPLLCVLQLALDTVSQRAGRYSSSTCAVYVALCQKEPPDPDSAMVLFSLNPHSWTVAHVQSGSTLQTAISSSTAVVGSVLGAFSIRHIFQFLHLSTERGLVQVLTLLSFPAVGCLYCSYFAVPMRRVKAC